MYFLVFLHRIRCNNEMIDWMKAIVAAHASTSTKLNLLLKEIIWLNIQLLKM